MDLKLMTLLTLTCISLTGCQNEKLSNNTSPSSTLETTVLQTSSIESSGALEEQSEEENVSEISSVNEITESDESEVPNKETTLSKADKLRQAINKKQNATNVDPGTTADPALEVSTLEEVLRTDEPETDTSEQESTTLSEEEVKSNINDSTTTTTSKESEDTDNLETNTSFSIDYGQYNSVEEVIEDLIDEYGFDSSNLGIAYQNFVTEESYFLNENKARHAASTNKVGTSVLYLDLIEMGALDWDSQLPSTSQDFEEGGGKITNSPPRSSYSLKELISNLLVFSDNTAWNILINYYNNNYGDYRNDLIELSGISNKPTALTHNMNFATPNMLIGYLNRIAREDKYQPIIDYMSIAQEGQRFKLYVDKGMATKYGQYGNGYHDTGIYFENGKPIYSLVLMTNDIGTVDSFMGELNLRINEWYHYQQ
ncbi:serine hydrolase [Facklamia miroungae]|uniref:Beta-lactamase enzyme family protein n=1 Tax=Facklamia miroungae TaxID=120956 RepID=A0A1G7TMB5_9LACT|nr:serine hydrolase [Facklamia miroungae]NKZ29774.1 serine hydrolase [Facklamia miroungae]SDG36468.1 Beta-lactamase enzyme family protein [Facklamia miroungae]